MILHTQKKHELQAIFDNSFDKSYKKVSDLYKELQNMYVLTWPFLLSRAAHVDSWRGGVRPFGDGVIHPDAPTVQLHAVGSLHRLTDTRSNRGTTWGWLETFFFAGICDFICKGHAHITLWALEVGRLSVGDGTLWQDWHLVAQWCNHT